mgnify:CR=1 FL=1
MAEKEDEKEIVSYCMGCGKIKHKKEGAEWIKNDGDVCLYSHGYCLPCSEKVKAEYEKELKEMDEQERQEQHDETNL